MGEAAGEAADKAADLSWADVCAPTEEEVHLFEMKNELMLDIGRLRLSLSGLDVPRLNDAVLEGEGSIPHFAEVAVVLDKIESQSGGRVAALVTTFGARGWTRMPGTPSGGCLTRRSSGCGDYMRTPSSRAPRSVLPMRPGSCSSLRWSVRHGAGRRPLELSSPATAARAAAAPCLNTSWRSVRESAIVVRTLTSRCARLSASSA